MSITDIVSGLPFGTHTVRVGQSSGIVVDGVRCQAQSWFYDMAKLLAKLDVLEWNVNPIPDYVDYTFMGTGLDIAVGPTKPWKVKV